MEIIIGIILLIFAIILIILAIIVFDKFEEAKSIGVFSLIFGMIFLIVGIGTIRDKYTPKQPTALDVYRGNTTLEITYKDSVPIDSVVVFKN